MLYLLIRFFKQNYDIKNIILDEGEIMMKKLTDFIIDKRYFVLGFFAFLVLISFILTSFWKCLCYSQYLSLTSYEL